MENQRGGEVAQELGIVDFFRIKLNNLITNGGDSYGRKQKGVFGGDRYGCDN